MKKIFIPLFIALILVSSIYAAGGGGGGAGGGVAVQTSETGSNQAETGAEEEGIGDVTGAVIGTTSKSSIILTSIAVGLAIVGLAFQIFSRKLRFKKRNGIF